MQLLSKICVLIVKLKLGREESVEDRKKSVEEIMRKLAIFCVLLITVSKFSFASRGKVKKIEKKTKFILRKNSKSNR